MAIEVGTAYVPVIPSFRNFGRNLTKGLTGELKTAGTTGGRVLGDSISDQTDKVGKESAKRFSGSFATALKGFGAGLLAGFGFDAIVGGIKGSITAASDLGETLNKTRVVFGQSSKDIIAWSKTSAQRFGLSQQAALSAAGTFGDMFSQLGFGAKQTTGMSKNVVQLAADLGSFHNVDPSEVLEKIGGAFRGEYDSLQALIPNLNAARVGTEALAATGKKSAEQLTAQEKATAALAIIQRDSKNAAGDFAETSDGLANRQRILAAQFEDAKAKLGNLLLPAMTAVAGFMSGTMVPGITKAVAAIKSFGQWIQRNQAWLLPLVAALGTFAFALAAGNLAMGIASGKISLMSKVTRAWAVVQGFLNAALLANPIVLIIAAIVALGVALVVAYKKSATFRKIVDGALKAIGAAAKWVWSTLLKPFIDGVVAGFTWVVNGAKTLYNGMVSAFTWIGQKAQWLWTTILSPIFSFIGKAIKLLAGIVVALLIGPWILAYAVISRIVRWLWANIIQPIFSKISAFIGQIIRWVLNFVVGTLTALFNFWRGIWSKVYGFVARIVSWIYSKIVKPYLTLIRAIWQRIFDAIAWLVERVLGWIAKYIGGILAAYKRLFSAGMDAISGIWSRALDWISGKVSSILDGIKRIWSTAFDWLSDKAQRVLDGIRGIFTKARDAIGAIWSKVTDKVSGPIRSLLKWINKNLIKKLNSVTTKFGLTIPEIKFAHGGYVRGPGGPTADKVRARLSAGEYVVRAKAVKRYGLGFFNNLNEERYRDGGLVSWHGGTFTSAMRDRLIRAERLAGTALAVTQGGFRPRTSYSGTTHMRDAVDIPNPTLGKVIALRKSAIAAWDRTGKGNWMPHIHGVPLPGGGVQLSSSAAGQVRSYLSGGDGLGGTDNGPGIFSKFTSWVVQGAKWLMRQAVKPLRALVNAIPGDGWAPRFFRGSLNKFLDSAINWAATKDTETGDGSSGANQAIARSMLGAYGWAVDQWPALRRLWDGESNWNHLAKNPNSGAYGIPQSLPGSKMSSAGRDWRTNPRTQIRWGMSYIKSRYGSPRNALSAWMGRSPHWYDSGGLLQPGATVAVNATKKPEAVLTYRQWRTLEAIADSPSAAPQVRVFIGERELTDIVRIELADHDHKVARTVRAGRRP